MYRVSQYTQNVINNKVEDIHEKSIKAASFLKEKDAKDFREGTAYVIEGKRYVELPDQYDPSFLMSWDIGLTVKKIKDLQMLELAYKVAQIIKSTPKTGSSPCNFLGGFVTTPLETGPFDKITFAFEEVVKEKEVTPKRSSAEVDSKYSVLRNREYLVNEGRVQREWSRLRKRGVEISKPNTCTYSEREMVVNEAVDRVAKDLVQSESNRRINNGRLLLAALIVIPTTFIATRVLPKDLDEPS